MICKKEIKPEQEKTIIYKNLTKKMTYRNMAYIHEFCKDSELRYIKYNEKEFNHRNFYELAEEFEQKKPTEKLAKKPSKFDKLTTYFHNVKKTKVNLKFSDIERLIGSKLCSSAYKYKSYFYNNKDESSITNCWLSQGYRVTKIDLEEKKISFEKDTQNKPRVMLPDYLFKEKIPHNAKVEIEDFLGKMKEKYRL